MAPSDRTLREIFNACRTIAVVGISSDAVKPSHYVAKYMQAQGFRIVPVNPRYTEVLGQACYASLEEIPFKVDLVDVFRRTEDVLPIAHSAVAIGARCLWQQVGVQNEQAQALVWQAGMQSVMDQCLMVEHARLLASGLISRI